jgi:glucose-1-phosphate thymidylyltransferase
MIKKGVILAGGNATRLFPLTKYVNKHLLPIYNKPMIHRSIIFLRELGINEILIICNLKDIKTFEIVKKQFRDLKINLKIQKKANGIAEGIKLCKNFIQKDNKYLFILGDNLLISKDYSNLKNEINKNDFNCALFTYSVKNPNEFGIITKNIKNKNIIVEKPKKKISNKAVVGLYIYDQNSFKLIKKIKPSLRNELEITDINNYYLENFNTKIIDLDKKNYKWFDIGSFDSLIEANIYIKNKNI